VKRGGYPNRRGYACVFAIPQLALAITLLQTNSILTHRPRMAAARSKLSNPQSLELLNFCTPRLFDSCRVQLFLFCPSVQFSLFSATRTINRDRHKTVRSPPPQRFPLPFFAPRHSQPIAGPAFLTIHLLRARPARKRSSLFPYRHFGLRISQPFCAQQLADSFSLFALFFTRPSFVFNNFRTL
jgi:hypothetical protein